MKRILITGNFRCNGVQKGAEHTGNELTADELDLIGEDAFAELVALGHLLVDDGPQDPPPADDESEGGEGDDAGDPADLEEEAEELEEPSEGDALEAEAEDEKPKGKKPKKKKGA